MTSHCWGDEWFEEHGDKLYEAEIFIVNYVKRWSRCRLMSKEKYGTIRYEWMFAPYVRIYYGDCKGLKLKLMWWWISRSKLKIMWTEFGWRMTARAIIKACDKWPDIKKELVCDFDRPELLSKELRDLHDSMWTRVN